jgi:hypothetical protein
MSGFEINIPSETDLNMMLIGGWMRSARPGRTEPERRAQREILFASYVAMQTYDWVQVKGRLLSSVEALEFASGREWVLEALCGALVNRPSVLHRLGQGQVHCSHRGCLDGYQDAGPGYLICC